MLQGLYTTVTVLQDRRTAGLREQHPSQVARDASVGAVAEPLFFQGVARKDLVLGRRLLQSRPGASAAGGCCGRATVQPHG